MLPIGSQHVISAFLIVASKSLILSELKMPNLRTCHLRGQGLKDFLAKRPEGSQVLEGSKPGLQHLLTARRSRAGKQGEPL